MLRERCLGSTGLEGRWSGACCLLALLVFLGRALVLEVVQLPEGAVIVGSEDLAAVECLLADPRAVAGAEVEVAALGSGLSEPLPDPAPAEPVRPGAASPKTRSRTPWSTCRGRASSAAARVGEGD